MGFLDGILGGTGGMKDPVRGTGQVVSASQHRGHGIYQNCKMQLVIQTDGVPATAVSFHGLVHNKRWPSPGMTLPVTVDRANPQEFKIEWDDVQDSGDRARSSAEQMAAAMRGDASAGGGAQVINLSGGDLSQLSDEQKNKLRMLGMLPPEATEPAPGASAAGEDDQIDDRLEQLERLAKLRDSGALTDAEFEAQKKQILD